MPGFPESVLIIDDDPDILDIEEQALKRVGDIEVHACNGYDQAMAISNRFIPNLILLDLKMPGKDGTDVVRAFRKKEALAKVPIVFITGNEKLSMHDHYRKLGVIGVIHKPFKPSDLVMKVQRLWQAHRFSGDE